MTTPTTSLPVLRGASVLVTGASAGIGRALAEQAAAHAAELILIARRGDRLSALADHLLAQHSRLQVHTVAGDLADTADLDRLLSRLGGDLPAGACDDHVRRRRSADS